MSTRHAFQLLNVLLLAVAGWLIYYLANSSYTPPPEVRDVEVIEQMTPKPPPEDLTSARDAGMRLRKAPNFMRVLFTLSPTPTATPPPTPTPIPLSVVLHSWQVLSLDDSGVDVLDQRTNEGFTLKLRGEPVEVEFQGVKYAVTCCQIDLDKLEVGFCANGVMTIKTL